MKECLILFFVFKIIECQVVLTRQLLDQWYGTSLTDLTRLDLSSKEIISIDPQTFKGLTNLQSLSLENNEITFIDPKTFNGLIKLENLYLYNNQIRDLDPETFNGFTNLIYLLTKQ